MKGSLRVKEEVSQTTKPYHPYVLKPENLDSIVIDEGRFAKYSKKHLDMRGSGKKSKAQRILEFLERHRNRLFLGCRFKYGTSTIPEASMIIAFFSLCFMIHSLLIEKNMWQRCLAGS